MNSNEKETAEKIVIEKSAVITFDDVVDEAAFRRYFKDHWKDLTLELNNSTILFLAGIHGNYSGELGENEDIQALKNQVRPPIFIYASLLSLESLNLCSRLWFQIFKPLHFSRIFSGAFLPKK